MIWEPRPPKATLEQIRELSGHYGAAAILPCLLDNVVTAEAAIYSGGGERRGRLQVGQMSSQSRKGRIPGAEPLARSFRAWIISGGFGATDSSPFSSDAVSELMIASQLFQASCVGFSGCAVFG